MLAGLPRFRFFWFSSAARALLSRSIVVSSSVVCLASCSSSWMRCSFCVARSSRFFFSSSSFSFWSSSCSMRFPVTRPARGVRAAHGGEVASASGVGALLLSALYSGDVWWLGKLSSAGGAPSLPPRRRRFTPRRRRFRSRFPDLHRRHSESQSSSQVLIMQTDST